MLPDNVQDSKNIPEAQRVALFGLQLSAEQKNSALEYYKISSKASLSDVEVRRLGEIWEQAEIDQTLGQALTALDSFRPKTLKDEELLSEDKDLRAYLSEHLSVLAEERLAKNSKSNRKELDTEIPYIAMICPDGSGIVYKNIQEDGFTRLDDVSLTFGEEVCERCNKKHVGTENLIFFPRTAFSPTSNS